MCYFLISSDEIDQKVRFLDLAISLKRFRKVVLPIPGIPRGMNTNRLLLGL